MMSIPEFCVLQQVRVNGVSGKLPRLLQRVLDHDCNDNPDAAMTSAVAALDGTLGDRLRATVVSTGTFAGSTVVSVRANIR